jgi:nucleoid-associated protein YgaU
MLLALASVGALLWIRPRFDAGVWQRGDDVALAAAWLVALAAGAWLFVVTGACLVAVGCSRPQLARRLAPVLPAGVRRLVELAVVGALVVVPAVPAHAAPAAPSPAVVLADQPVVRAAAVGPSVSTVPTTPPRPVAPTTVPLGSRPAPTTTTTSGTAGPKPAARSNAAPPPRVAPSAPTEGNTGRAQVVVRAGDNLWRIARTTLQASAEKPTESEIARYWHEVIAANRSTLRSGNPSLIYPGEIVTLPPASGVS